MRSGPLLRLLLTLALLFPLVPTAPRAAAAQNGSGTGQLMGQVRDQDTGMPLPGVQVRVDGTNLATLAGVEGMYRLQNIPAGRTALRVTMIGHAPKVITGIEVRAGATERFDIVLERRPLVLGEVVVAAERERGSSVSILGEQRQAAAIVNAISAEQIGRSPDGDAAAAIRRVSGVTVQEGRHVFVRGLGERYTTSALNGARIPSPDPERRSVPLDLFPSGLLEAISTSKTFTPDHPGDFAGGAVDIRTPRFPATRTFSLSVSSGYHPDITGRPMLMGPTQEGEWLAMGSRERRIPDTALRFSGSQTRGDEVNDVINSFRNAWSVREGTGRAPVSVSGSGGGSGELFGSTVGALGSLTYSNAPGVKLDQRRARVGTGATEIDRYDGAEGSASVLWGGLLNVGALLGNHSQIHLNNTFNRSGDHQARFEVGLDENTRSRVRIDRLTYIERVVRSHRLNGVHQLRLGHDLDWSVSRSDVSRSEPDRSEFVTWLDQEVPTWFKDFEGAVRTFGQLEEGAWEADLGYTLRFGRDGDRPHRVRAGVAHRFTDRDAWSQGFRMQPFDWTPTDPRWQVSPEEIFDGRYTQEGQDLIILSRELSGGSYRASDRLTAGFLMADLRARSYLRLIVGARVEDYHLEVHSESQLGQRAFTDKRYTDVLPSLVATFELPREHQIRLAVSRTLARPEYREVAPITYREVLGGEQVIGNLDLERTLIDNLDLRWEWYPRPGEVLSVGAFAKSFDQPIEQRYLARSGTLTRTFTNAEHATNVGLELEANQRLDRIHDALSSIAVFGNATVMRSRVQADRDGEADRAMVGQAPFVVNAGLGYARTPHGLSGTLLYNVVGKRIVNARASGTQVDDVIERPAHVMDLSIRFPVAGSASGKIDIKNLLDAPYEVVQGPIVREYHRSGRSVSFGLSWQW